MGVHQGFNLFLGRSRRKQDFPSEFAIHLNRQLDDVVLQILLTVGGP